MPTEPTVIQPRVTRFRVPDEATADTDAIHGDDWLCSLCLEKMAAEIDRFFYEGKNAFSFTNPGGYQFEIMVFSQADGCRAVTPPTSENTWFPGYAWSICLCRSCGQHMGWKYIGADTFFGLIRTKLVRGTSVLN